MTKQKADSDSPTQSALKHPGHYPGGVKRPDKTVVIGDLFSDAVLESYLHVVVPSGESEDYCRMRVAYQSMPLEAFERFLDLAQSRGKNVNPPDGAGRFFLQLLEGNVSQREYGEALKRRLRDA